jgi:hypothetical protein
VLSPVLNFKIYQGQVKHIIINHRKKLMEVGGKEKIFLKGMATRLIDPSLKIDTMYI